MNDTLLAIDPATYKLGIAIFKKGRLVAASSIHAEERERDRLVRLSTMIDRLGEVMTHFNPSQIVVEDPLLKGHGNKLMERLKGAIEATAEILLCWPSTSEKSISDFYHYIHPTTVKMHLKKGDAGKLEVAMAALDWLNSDEEKAILNKLILLKDYDATDAVAIGICHLMQTGVLSN